MSDDLDFLVDLLDLEPIEVNIFRGTQPEEKVQRVFGGQVAGQALMAAGRFHHSLDLLNRENVWDIARLGLRCQAHARNVSPRVPAAPKMAELPYRP